MAGNRLRKWIPIAAFVALIGVLGLLKSRGYFSSPAPLGADSLWLHEFDDAVAAAKRENKDLLIDFSGTDWCLPCERLWNETLSKPEFIKLARRRFVLLDIDDLVEEGAMPKGRKERYEALQNRYGVQAFPTVVLASADGVPYAVSGLVEGENNPADYWRLLESLHDQGERFKASLAVSGGAGGLTSAEKIVDALAELRPDFVSRFHGDQLARLRALDPKDTTGYLAFIAARTELLTLQWKLHEAFLVSNDKWNDGDAKLSPCAVGFAPSDIDTIIAKHQLQGESLRDALLTRAFIEIDAGLWSQAAATLQQFADVPVSESRFDRKIFTRITVVSEKKLREHLAIARESSDDPLAQLRAMYKVVENDLENETPTLCCNHCFNLQLLSLVTSAAYGETLLAATAELPNEARAKAIGAGLADIELYSNGSIGRIVIKLIPELVGKEHAKEYLPPRYAEWIDIGR